MKKILIILLFILCSFSVFAIERTMGLLNVKIGDDVKLPLSGKIVQLGNKGLPKVFNKDTIVLATENSYYYQGKKVTMEKRREIFTTN